MQVGMYQHAEMQMESYEHAVHGHPDVHAYKEHLHHEHHHRTVGLDAYQERQDVLDVERDRDVDIESPQQIERPVVDITFHTIDRPRETELTFQQLLERPDIPFAPPQQLLEQQFWPPISLTLHTNGADCTQQQSIKPNKRVRQTGKPQTHYQKERQKSLEMVLKLPIKTRQLFCVSEFYKYMASSRPKSPSLKVVEDSANLGGSQLEGKVTDAYEKAGESVGVTVKTARKWVEDWESRGDGTFSDSRQGKHAKVEWILQPEHLQARARQWIEQNCPKKGDPPRKESIINQFRDFCNTDLLLEVQAPKQTEGGMDVALSSHRKISSETARSWLHRLGFHNFKDFRGSSVKSHQ